MFFTSKLFLGKCSHFIPRVSLFRFPFSPFSNIINKDPPLAEPDSFVERDKAELQVYFSEKYVHWKYKKIRDGWQKPLEKKRLRRERKALESKVSIFPFYFPYIFLIFFLNFHIFNHIFPINI